MFEPCIQFKTTVVRLFYYFLLKSLENVNSLLNNDGAEDGESEYNIIFHIICFVYSNFQKRELITLVVYIYCIIPIHLQNNDNDWGIKI